MNLRQHYTKGVVSSLLLALVAPSRSQLTFHDIVRQHLARSSNDLAACYGALHLSDDDGDGILKADEYAGFISRISGDDHEVESFDDLPFVLRINFSYLSCRCRLHPRAAEHGGDRCCRGSRKGIYVFGTGPTEVPTPGEDEYLRGVCADTVGTMEYEPPTDGPTKSPTARPTLTPEPPRTNDLTACYGVLHLSDDDGDGILQADEYVGFISRIDGDNPRAQSFDDLPFVLRINFAHLSCQCKLHPRAAEHGGDGCCRGSRKGIYVFGTGPTEVPTPGEEEYLRGVCADTVGTIEYEPATGGPTARPTRTPGPPRPDRPTGSPATESPTRQRTAKPVLITWSTESPATQSPATESPTDRPSESPVTESPTKQSTAKPVLIRWPTESPVTESPTRHRNPKPPRTNRPSESPSTESPSKRWTRMPAQIRWPTDSPATESPMKQPTLKPVQIRSPTKSPVTQGPTGKPTPAPVQTRWPTNSPVTESPTRRPTPVPVRTRLPTAMPATESPTKQPAASTSRGSPSPAARPIAEGTQHPSSSLPPSRRRGDLSMEEGARTSYSNNPAEESKAEERAGSVLPGAAGGVVAAISICAVGAFLIARRRNEKGRQSGDGNGSEEEDSTLESSLKDTSSSNGSPAFDEDPTPGCEGWDGREPANGVVHDLEARREEGTAHILNLSDVIEEGRAMSPSSCSDSEVTMLVSNRHRATEEGRETSRSSFNDSSGADSSSAGGSSPAARATNHDHVVDEEREASRSPHSDSSSVATTLVSNCGPAIEEGREISCTDSSDSSSVDSSSAGDSGWTSSAGNSLTDSLSSSTSSGINSWRDSFNSSFNSAESPQHTGARKEIAQSENENHASGDEHRGPRGERESLPAIDEGPRDVRDDSTRRSDPLSPRRAMPIASSPSAMPSAAPPAGGDSDGASGVDAPMNMNWDGMGRIASLLAEYRMDGSDDEGDKKKSGGMMAKMGFGRRSSHRSGGSGAPAKEADRAGASESTTIRGTPSRGIPPSPNRSRRPVGEAVSRPDSEGRGHVQLFNALVARGDWSGAVAAAGEFREIEGKDDGDPGRLTKDALARRQPPGGRDEEQTPPKAAAAANGNPLSKAGSQYKAQRIELRLRDLGAVGPAARRAGRLVHVHYITLSARGGDGGVGDWDVDAVISTMAEHGLSGDSIASILSRRPAVAMMRARTEEGLVSRDMLEVLAGAAMMDS